MANRVSISTLLLVGLLASCAGPSHQLIRQPGGTGGKISPHDSVYIAVSRDGSYGDEAYPGSGIAASQALLSAFSKKARKVEAASSHQEYEDALRFAQEKGYKYLVYPMILHWEDRATEWNALPDKVEIKIQVVDVATDALLDGVVISAKSSLATWGGDHPQDLLPKPVEEFVSSLY